MKKVAVAMLLMGVPFVATGEKAKQFLTGKTPRGTVFVGESVPKQWSGMKVVPLLAENRVVIVKGNTETMFERLLRKTLPGRQIRQGNVLILSGNFSAESSRMNVSASGKTRESTAASLTAALPSASPNPKPTKVDQEAPVLEWAQSLSLDDPQLRETDAKGRTALHNALYHKYVRVAEMLIQKGSDVQHRDLEGFTPLHIAAFNGLSEMANLLISKGADVNAHTPSGKTPLTIARMNNFHALYDFLTKNGGRE